MVVYNVVSGSQVVAKKYSRTTLTWTTWELSTRGLIMQLGS
jgi:hypothetical protein